MSVYAFGEEEEELERQAKSNGGLVNFQHIANYYGYKNLHNVSTRVRRSLKFKLELRCAENTSASDISSRAFEACLLLSRSVCHVVVLFRLSVRPCAYREFHSVATF